ncbi:hypothetical protein N657DRAFT_637653 [Parathielavia appendiculata]|uniref:Uncharacterized protein n=1 Tax=Parathielavia appendiculata TaxID=2587402 RepID=A0AAN6TQV7_9PEZI|nr:hypothetical protein N657DRAFT_637653 [Parathielavia appendiculata]
MPSQLQFFQPFRHLPADIRNDIWDRTAQQILARPSVEFTTFRAFINIDDMDSVLSSNSEQQRATLLTRSLDFRKMHITWEQSDTAAQPPRHSAMWQVTELAAAYRELECIPNKAIRWWSQPVPAPTATQNFRFVERINMSQDIILLTGPEEAAWLPVFGYCPRRDRQIVVVGGLSMPELAWQNRWDQLPPNLTERCPELVDWCPAFSRVTRVAFLYDKDLDRAGHQRLPYYQRLGLQHLWPHNMPVLQEIYLLDESIKLRSESALPPATVRRFPGHGSSFYEVDWKQSKVWKINTPKGDLIRVFSAAIDLQAKYDRVGSPSMNMPELSEYPPDCL